MIWSQIVAYLIFAIPIILILIVLVHLYSQHISEFDRLLPTAYLSSIHTDVKPIPKPVSLTHLEQYHRNYLLSTARHQINHTAKIGRTCTLLKLGVPIHPYLFFLPVYVYPSNLTLSRVVQRLTKDGYRIIDQGGFDLTDVVFGKPSSIAIHWRNVTEKNLSGIPITTGRPIKDQTEDLPPHFPEAHISGPSIADPIRLKSTHKFPTVEETDLEPAAIRKPQRGKKRK